MSTVDNLKAGPSLDALVAEKVMGAFGPGLKTIEGFRAMPCYSTDIAAAWKLVEKFGFMVHPTGNGPHGKPAAYWVGFPRDGHMGLVGDMENETVACAESAPLAIALAALKQVDES